MYEGQYFLRYKLFAIFSLVFIRMVVGFCSILAVAQGVSPTYTRTYELFGKKCEMKAECE